MREALCRSLVDHASRPDFVFLTGDLGFNALEPLRDRMGPRFLNAGVAEQKVHLFLFVKVREGWGDDPERYREMGIEFPKY